MKLVVFCLFAVCCCSLVESNKIKRKLEEVIKELNDVKRSLQNKEQMLLNAPENIEDCCSLSALECFRANLNVNFNVTEGTTKKLYRSLQHSLTIRGLNFCMSGNAQSMCQVCDAQPKVNVTTFFDRLESLVQRGNIRLSKK